MTSGREYLRYVRIGTTGFFAVLCVVVIVLWVRSYFFYDSVHFWRVDATRCAMVDSFAGRVFLIISPSRAEWSVHSRRLDGGQRWFRNTLRANENRFGFFQISDWGTDGFIFPHWWLIAVFASIGAMPWIQSRFSLGTLFVIMTTVALVCGAIAMM